MIKGMGNIMVGLVLIILQVIAIESNALSGDAKIYMDIPYLIGYFLCGIIGIAQLVIGLVKFIKSQKKR